MPLPVSISIGASRFERGARLAQRLGGAVELALVVGEAAGHRQYPPGLRIHGDDGAGDFRYLAQAELAVLVGERLHINDVARREYLRDLARGLAPHRAAGRPRPLDAFERNRAGLALLGEHAARFATGLQADASRRVVGLQHHRQPPRPNI